MHSPYFSVIIPTYNRENFLATAVNSVLGQTFQDFELIIVDDDSTDQTEQLIKALKDKRLKYIKIDHRGVSAARNTGIQHSRGQFISFLDSDDIFKGTKLEITYKYIQDFPNHMIFHTEELWYRNDKILNQKNIHKKPEGNVFANSLKLCCIGMSTAVVKKTLFNQIGLFDEKFSACEDYELWLRATALHPVKLIPEILTIKQGGHADQLSKKYPAMDTLRIQAIVKLLESKIPNAIQENLAIKELHRKCKIYIKGAEKRNKLKEITVYKALLHKYPL